MSSKKKLKQRLKSEKHIADELFVQVGQLAGQLARVDEILVKADLPGPTIEAWAMQVRDLLSSLVQERGIVAGGIYQVQTVHTPTGRSAPFVPGPARDNGEYSFLTDNDLKPFPKETHDLLMGRTSVPAGTGRFA